MAKGCLSSRYYFLCEGFPQERRRDDEPHDEANCERHHEFKFKRKRGTQWCASCHLRMCEYASRIHFEPLPAQEGDVNDVAAGDAAGDVAAGVPLVYPSKVLTVRAVDLSEPLPHAKYFWVRYQNQPPWLMGQKCNLAKLINEYPGNSIEALPERAALDIIDLLNARHYLRHDGSIGGEYNARLAPYEAVICTDSSVTERELGTMLKSIEEMRCKELRMTWPRRKPYPKLVCSASRTESQGTALLRIGRTLLRSRRSQSAGPAPNILATPDDSVAGIPANRVSL